MEEKKLVSIIVPIYNVENYLERAIKSILNQTYNNIELIMINDGSKDNSLAICKKYEKNDKRIKIINQHNQGVSVARNEGIKHAKGEYISFVDPDDYIEKNMIELMVEDMERYQSHIVLCGVKDIMEETGKIIHQTQLKKSYEMNNETFLNEMLLGKQTTSVWNKIFRKEIIEGIWFNSNKKIGEDFEFLIYIIDKNPSMKIWYNTKHLYNWISRKASATKTETVKYVEDIQEINKIIDSFVQNKYPNLQDIVIYKSLMNYRLCIKKIKKGSKNRKNLSKEIRKLEKKYFISSTFGTIHKLKYWTRYKIPIFYKMLKKIKNEMGEKNNGRNNE